MPEKPKILIVDDKRENLYSLEKLLQKLDVIVFPALSGNEALGLTLEHEFCMAIIDVQMPEMDGYELVELIRTEPATSQLPVIFVSAIYSDEYHHRRGYDAGAVDFVSKPFIPEILLSKIRVFIRLYEQHKQLTQWNKMLEQTVEQRTHELSVTNARLERLDQAKSDFIEVVAHELRTPLTLITGYISMLKRATPDPDQLRTALQGMDTGSERMLDIINSILDIARIDNQVLKVHPTPLALVKVFERLKNNLQEALSERHIQLGWKDLGKLPLVNVDPDLMYKLFYQLVVNAIKFTPDGGVISISGLAKRVKGIACVEIQVVDSGIGIAPENQELIFEKFFQLKPARLHSSGKYTFKGGGPGLGLAVAKGIVIAHGGRIWVESRGYDAQTLPGSTFHVLLPVDNQENVSS